jgi:hypothetical protein
MSDEEQDQESIAPQLREFYDAVLAFQSKAMGEASAYNQVIVLAGYAAFFAIWSSVTGSVPKWVTLICGGLMLISVVVYVGWTVINMIFLKTHYVAMSLAVGEGVEGFYERALEVEKNTMNRGNKIMRWWLPVVAAAGGTALLAAVLLSGAAFTSVVTSASPAKSATNCLFTVNRGRR